MVVGYYVFLIFFARLFICFNSISVSELNDIFKAITGKSLKFKTIKSIS